MAVEKKIIIDVDTVKAAGGIDKLKKKLKETDKEVKETSKSTEAMSNTLDKATGGAVSKFNAFRGAIGTVIGGFKSLKIAIIGTGIGALIIAITSLTQAFTRSEEGQNKFAKILGVIGSVTGNLLDLLADLGEGIISVFENPKQALIDFKDLLVTNITNRFKAILDTVGFLGSAIQKVFSKDFKGALDDAKKAGSSFVDSFTGVENSIDKATESVKSFAKEIKDDATAAAKIADQRAAAEKKARQLVVERAEAERKIADLREKAVNKDKFTAAERIAFLEEAGRVSDELAAKEIAVSKLRLEAKKTENALTKSNKEDLDEQARLEAEVIQKETARINLQKRLSTELLTNRRENSADQVRIEKEKEAELEKIRQASINTEEEKRAEEIRKVEDQYTQLLEKAKEYYGKESDQVLQLEQSKKEKLDELRAGFKAKDDEAQAKLDEEEAVKRQKELDAILKEEEFKRQQKEETFNNALAIAGEESKLGQAILIAKQVLQAKEMILEMKSTLFAAKNSVQKATLKGAEAGADVAAGAGKSASAAPFPANIPLILGYAAQAVGIISAVKGAVNKAKSVGAKFGAAGGSSIQAPQISTGGGAPQPPSFNIVGANQTSQLAEAVAGQTQQPVQAYVVANDVTTAQSLENNIVEGATL